MTTNGQVLVRVDAQYLGIELIPREPPLAHAHQIYVYLTRAFLESYGGSRSNGCIFYSRHLLSAADVVSKNNEKGDGETSMGTQRLGRDSNTAQKRAIRALQSTYKVPRSMKRKSPSCQRHISTSSKQSSTLPQKLSKTTILSLSKHIAILP